MVVTIPESALLAGRVNLVTETLALVYREMPGATVVVEETDDGESDTLRSPSPSL